MTTGLKKPSLIILLVILSGLLLFTVSGTALADTVGPTFNTIFPANGSTVSQTKIVISLTAYDADFVNFASLLVKVDGNPVSYIAQYTPIDESTDDYTTLEIYYPATLTTGTHNVQVSVKDNLGNTGSTSWSFTVGNPPKILSLSPANGAAVITRTPVISAAVTSSDQINPGTIVMTLNSTAVNAVLDQIYNTISYTPATPLDNETFYNVYLTFKDTAGKTTTATWQFYTNTFQEMAYLINDATCQQCHDRTKHPMNNCTKCHGTSASYDRQDYPVDDCYLCHFNAPYPSTYHTNGLPYATPPNHPVFETDSCIGCHDRTWPGTTIPSIHNIFNTAVEHNTTTTGCTNCHAVSLTREHLRRLDDQGNQLTCFTCHSNPDPNIKNAIATRDSSCAACHGLSAHPEHVNGLDANCQTCHSTTIISEPVFHSQNDCSICHTSSNPLVQYSINTGNSNCVSCHNQGHNLYFVQKTPTDIPIYPGYEWSIPQNATVWGGEPWFPQEFNTAGAKLLISNHRQDVSGIQLFDWFTQQLAANGWSKISGPTQGSSNFTLAYEKGIRRVTVIVYGGTSHDPTSPFVGSRIEILYK